MTKRYQQIAISLYFCVMLATLLLVIVERSGRDVERHLSNAQRAPALPVVIVIAVSFAVILTLIYLEYSLRNAQLHTLSLQAANTQLALRFTLVVIAALLGRAPFSAYLFYPVVLFAFFTQGRKIAYRVAIAAFFLVLCYTAFYAFRWGWMAPDINNLMIFVLGMLLVLLLANALYQEWELGQDLSQAHHALADSHAQLQAYSAQVATLAAIDERNRLARDIHDSLGHHLAATSIQLEKAAVFSQRDPAKSTEALGHARRTIREALTEVRTSLHTLREPSTQFALGPELQSLVNRMSHTDLDIDLRIEGDLQHLPIFSQMTLYRIAQEAITNVHKHAQASAATVSLTITDQHATLNINDNGIGITKTSQPSHHTGFGLTGIQERVALVGGKFELTNALPQGTELSVVIPSSVQAQEQPK